MAMQKILIGMSILNPKKVIVMCTLTEFYAEVGRTRTEYKAGSLKVTVSLFVLATLINNIFFHLVTT
jgi:hypothetical protein